MIDSKVIEQAASQGSFLDIAKPVIAGQIRHLISGVGLALAAKGALDPGQTAQFVDIGSGLIMYLVGAGWSWWQKVGQARVLDDLARFHNLVIKNVKSNKS